MAIEAGSPIDELKVTPDRFLPIRYAGASGDFNPIHTDKEYATMVGLPSTILHGLGRWRRWRERSARTPAAGQGPEPLRAVPRHGFPEKEITVSGSTTSVEDGVATVELVAEQDGNQIIRNAVGTVSA